MAVKVGTKRRYKTTGTIAEEPRVLDLAVVERRRKFRLRQFLRGFALPQSAAE